MMTVKIVRAYDVDDNTHMYSIVAWDKGFAYAQTKGSKAFDSARLVKSLMGKIKPDLKPTVDDYINIAKMGLGRFKYGSPIEEAGSQKTALKGEQVALDKAYALAVSRRSNQRLIDSNEDMQQVLFDYPELYDQLADGTVDITADGMLELIMAALGSIDPEGPNKWLLDYMDGNELPEGEIPQIVFDETTPKETGK